MWMMKRVRMRKGGEKKGDKIKISKQVRKKGKYLQPLSKKVLWPLQVEVQYITTSSSAGSLGGR